MSLEEPRQEPSDELETYVAWLEDVWLPGVVKSRVSPGGAPPRRTARMLPLRDLAAGLRDWCRAGTAVLLRRRQRPT